MATVFVKLTFLLIVFELTTAAIEMSDEEQKAWNALSNEYVADLPRFSSYMASLMQAFMAKNDCVDNHEDCEYWAGIGECDKNPDYMLINCKKSCEVCRGESIKDCVDNHEHCEYWAGIGECDKNPDYMLIKCKKSCEVCPE